MPVPGSLDFVRMSCKCSVVVWVYRQYIELKMGTDSRHHAVAKAVPACVPQHTFPLRVSATIRTIAVPAAGEAD